jgi:ankyrin repeat protein
MYNNLFEELCIHGHLNFCKSLYLSENKPDKKTINKSFWISCRYGKLEIVKWLYSLDDKPDIHYLNDAPYEDACYNGHINIIKFLFDIDKKNINKKHGFNFACRNGHLNLAHYIYSHDNDCIKDNYNALIYACENIGDYFIDLCWKKSLKKITYEAFKNKIENQKIIIINWLNSIDNKFIRYNNDQAFRIACDQNNIKIALLLSKLCSNYSIEFEDNKIKKYCIV